MKKGFAVAIYLLLALSVFLGLSNAGNLHLTSDSGFAQPARISSSSVEQRYGCSDSPSVLLAKDNGKSNGAQGKIGSGNKSGKPDLRDVDWSKPPSVRKVDSKGNGNGNGNGDNGDENKDDKDNNNGENGEKEEESEGFDRLWDVILLG